MKALCKKGVGLILSRKKEASQKNGSLAVRIPLQIVGLIFIVMIILCISLGIILSNTYSKNIQKDINRVANANAATLKEYFNTMSVLSQSLSDQVARYQTQDPEVADKLIRKSMESILTNDKLYTTYVALEPQYFPDTPSGRAYFLANDGTTTVTHDNDSEGPCYSLTKQNMATVITEPYTYTLPSGESKWFISISSPIIDEAGKFWGIATCDILTDTTTNLEYDMGGYETSYSYV